MITDQNIGADAKYFGSNAVRGTFKKTPCNFQAIKVAILLHYFNLGHNEMYLKAENFSNYSNMRKFKHLIKL